MNISKFIDHTNLKPFSTKDDIIKICDEAKKYHFASVCVNPCNIKLVAENLVGSDVLACSVIGFPFGTHTTEVKETEAKKAILDGAQELDMVINVGKLLDGEIDYVKNEVASLVKICHSNNSALKVIIETCFLNEQQIKTMCEIVEETGADFIKTSTGYGTRGANVEDIRLFNKYLLKSTKIKASGGIRNIADATKFIALGCSRIGTSNGVEILDENY